MRRGYSIFYLLVTVSKVLGQCLDTQPFATAQRSPTNINQNTTREFTTEFRVLSENQNDTTVNETIFLNAANNFYDINPPTGFISPVLIVNNARIPSTSEIQVRYTTKYNYTTLNENPSPNQLVQQTIGNFTFVSRGFLSDSTFNLFYNISGSFTFSSNPLCPTFVCGSSHLECTEDDATATCASICCNAYCFNNGYCHHTNPDESPFCSCPSSSTTWYVGDRCESMLGVWMIVVFFVLVGIILILIPLITFLCYRKIDKKLLKQKQKENEKMLKAAIKEKEAQEKAQAAAENASRRNNEIKTSNNVNGGSYSLQPHGVENRSFSAQTSEDSFEDSPPPSRISSTGERKESGHESTPGSIGRVSENLQNSGDPDVNATTTNHNHESTSLSSSSSSSESDYSNTYNYLKYNHPPSYNPPPSYVNTPSRSIKLENPKESTV